MKTNREYFSWSQYDLWKKSPKQFHKKYVLGEDDSSNRRFDKGKEFAEYKEKGLIPHYCDDPLLESVGNAVPRLEVMEYKFETYLKGVKLLAYIDSFSLRDYEVFEYKTGKEPWTQERVDKHFQLNFYAAMVAITCGVIPKVTLYWIETEDIEEDGKTKIRYTGHIEKFVRKFTEKDILDSIKSIEETYSEILDYQYEEVQLSDELAIKFDELTDKKKEIDKELDLIKMQFTQQLQNNQSKYGVTSAGTFTLGEQKSYTYSKKIKDYEAKHKAEMSKMKKEEEENGTAEKKVTNYIIFKKAKQNV